jgi:hypothetical protein
LVAPSLLDVVKTMNSSFAKSWMDFPEGMIDGATTVIFGVHNEGLRVTGQPGEAAGEEKILH